MTLPVNSKIPLLLFASTAYAKQRSRLVTAEMRANAVANAQRYSWAEKEQQEAIANAGRWVKLSDDELWQMITSQELPRDIHTNKTVGCPNCGDGIFPYGNYPWTYDFWHEPWKLKCPNCGSVYPKNDFSAFYQTALDEHHTFHRELGDRSRLFNAEHPDPKDPLHQVYVDDGYGMVDEKGNRHKVIAYYNQWAQWRTVYAGLAFLERAYTLTEDKRYAHKAAVLLDRIADIYPAMDFAPLHYMGFEHSHGGPGRGRIEGCIWETNTTRMAYTYDHIFEAIQDDQELVAFCAQKSAQYKLEDKSSIGAICRHIEDHLLLEILTSVKDGRIDGNTGMTHTCLATTAIALDRPEVTAEWLDWLFDPRYPGDYPRQKDAVPWVLVAGLDRDGMGGECGGYGLIWTRGFVRLAEILALYAEYAKHNPPPIKEYPKLKQCFLVEPRLNCLDAVLPPIGDSGSTGVWGRTGSVSTFVRGFRLYGDEQMAAFAWHYAGGDVNQLRLSNDIFEKDPETLAQQIASTARKTGPFKLKCEHLGRYGQVVLQTEDAHNGRAVWLHYGYGKGHSHRDCLNLGLYAKNIDMLPDLGYPEYTGGWPKRHAWTANTISHNTLLVNDTQSAYSPGGKINLFAVQPPARLVDVSSKSAYEGLETYRRTVALIDVSDEDGYVFDVFRARGGSNHRLSYHGPAAAAKVQGIRLVKQATGTFAGPDMEFATLDGENSDFYRQSGFTYLYDIERSEQPVDSYFTVDWRAEDQRGRIEEGNEPHLRLYALTACDEVALASGDPPQNKSGNPRRLRYLIQSRLGEDMASQFVTILEPYDKTPFIRRVRRLKVEHDADPNAVAAVAVELASGMTDILINCEEPTQVKVEGGITFEGQFGLARLVDGKVKLMRMSNARLLKSPPLGKGGEGGFKLTGEKSSYEGKVTKIDVSDPEDNLIFLQPSLPQNLLGQTIHFKNDLPLDTSYDIKAVGDGWISTGDITIVAGFSDPQDFNSGYKYLVNVGDEYIVPCSAGLDW